MTTPPHTVFRVKVLREAAAVEWPDMTTVTIYAGPDLDHLTRTGTLYMSPVEAAELVQLLDIGMQVRDQTGCTLGQTAPVSLPTPGVGQGQTADHPTPTGAV